jgi:hypothetical protein
MSAGDALRIIEKSDPTIPVAFQFIYPVGLEIRVLSFFHQLDWCIEKASEKLSEIREAWQGRWIEWMEGRGIKFLIKKNIAQKNDQQEYANGGREVAIDWLKTASNVFMFLD